jgi:hypothetical protein
MKVFQRFFLSFYKAFLQVFISFGKTGQAIFARFSTFFSAHSPSRLRACRASFSSHRAPQMSNALAPTKASKA